MFLNFFYVINKNIGVFLCGGVGSWIYNVNSLLYSAFLSGQNQCPNHVAGHQLLDFIWAGSPYYSFFPVNIDFFFFGIITLVGFLVSQLSWVLLWASIPPSVRENVFFFLNQVPFVTVWVRQFLFSSQSYIYGWVTSKQTLSKYEYMIDALDWVGTCDMGHQ
jgi:hypothetical protein